MTLQWIVVSFFFFFAFLFLVASICWNSLFFVYLVVRVLFFWVFFFTKCHFGKKFFLTSSEGGIQK